jgi:hypothetical protein
MPGFVARPAPLDDALDAIERGVARRSARLWAPRYVGGALALRGVLQPLTEWRVKRSRRLPEALRLADPPAGSPLLSEREATLGVAAQVADVGTGRAPLRRSS